MVKHIFFFPGQGAQYPGMGRDLFDASPTVRELFELASDCSKTDLKAVLFSGADEQLRQTEFTQTAITLVNMSAYYLLKERGVHGDVFAGFSLGELSAYHAAGILDLRSLFEIAALRGRLMSEGVMEASEGIGDLGMAAVIGLDYRMISEVLSAKALEHLYIANDNSVKQVVISGVQGAIEQITPVLKAAGARRVIPLKVSGPFHTPLMKHAEERFSESLVRFQFSDPVIPVYTNVTGALIRSGSEAKEVCARQLTSPVRWTSIVAELSGETYEDVQSCFEVGPGKVLSGFWKAGPSSVPCLGAGTVEAIEKIVTEISAS